MAAGAPEGPQAGPQVAARRRVPSIDLLRGADVLLMLFVNEVAGVPGAPAFLLHVPRGRDGMTLTDAVFPAFLFVVGMALPFSLDAARRAGRAAALAGVLRRTAALLLLGLLMLNAEHAVDGFVSAPAWNLLATTAAVLAWHEPDRPSPWTPRLRLAGVLALAALALAFRAEGGSGLLQIRTGWWGILGLIGWSYLVAAGTLLLVGERIAPLVAAVALLDLAYFAQELGWIPILGATRPFLDLGRAVAPHAAIALSGVALAVMLRRHRATGLPAVRFLPRALAYAAALLVAGLLLHARHAAHPAFWISKLLATPAWGLVSAAGTIAAWCVCYWLVDVRGMQRGPRILAVAGENALLAYLAAPFLLSLFAWIALVSGTANLYEALASPLALGLARSAFFAMAVVGACAVVRSFGVRLKL
jgi:predicted acyltransferase